MDGATVDVPPPEPEQLPLSQPGEERRRRRRQHLRALHGCEHPVPLLHRPGASLLGRQPGRSRELGNVGGDVPVPDGVVEGGAQDGAEVAHAARREVRLGSEESLHVRDRERGELLVAEARDEVEPGDVLVPLVRLESEPALLGREPAPEPLLHGQALPLCRPGGPGLSQRYGELDLGLLLGRRVDGTLDPPTVHDHAVAAFPAASSSGTPGTLPSVDDRPRPRRRPALGHDPLLAPDGAART